MEAHASAHSEPHASNGTYLAVASVLAVLTATEVAVYFLDFPRPLMVTLLVGLSAAKFALVVMFFMHLKFDSPVYRGLFLGPLAVAIGVILAMMGLYSVI